ncbi:MAG: NAD(+)/NADH kinase [Acutalibacteraceae bacterium]|nr:NAD(+)/NADH kinase [Acutalibacteraceae bacterium]
MKIALLPNLTRKNALKVSLEVCKKLDELNAYYMVKIEDRKLFEKTKAEFLSQDKMISECDVIITVGGDGTIIHAAKAGKPILGINAGRIAFMAGLESAELDMLKNLIDGNYENDRRMMLKADVCDSDGNVVKTCFCVNDVVVARGKQIKMEDISVEHNGKLINNYTADGVIISTPTGSTAYSLSAGGPVVDPQIESILLTPICTHSLFSRALIFKPDSVFRLYSPTSAELSLSCDGEDTVTVPGDHYVLVTKAEIYGDFIRIKNETFLEILNSKLAQRRL